jgi:protein-S-isoprenylcysteine O-methyltransferase Ste14
MNIPENGSSFLFRTRYLLHVVLFGLGWLAPWNLVYRIDPPGPNAHVWGLLAVQLGLTGAMTISQAFNLLLGLGVVCAVTGAWLRVWGSAYLGTRVVYGPKMQMPEVTAIQHLPTLLEEKPGLLTDGPFRHLRNPLYVGTFVFTLALALLMTASGAIFTIVGITALEFLLIVGEEQFLSRQLGESYAAYCKVVPRLWPRIRGRARGTGRLARWPQAVLGEIFFVGVAGSFVAVGWLYNAHILQQCVLVSFGLSLVMRAVVPSGPKPVQQPTAS